MDREAQRATVHGVTKSWTPLRDLNYHSNQYPRHNEWLTHYHMTLRSHFYAFVEEKSKHLFTQKLECKCLFIILRHHVCAKSLQSCQNLCNPWTAARQAPLSMGFSRQEESWSGLPCPPPGEYPNPGIELASLMSNLHWQFFTTSATWEAPQTMSAPKCSLMGEWLNKPW